jgi:NDP-sugar pyrophosphorylase family protein
VAGVPLIAWVLRNFLAVGIAAPVVIVNEDARACVEWVRERFPGVQFIVKTTRSSLESFLEVSQRLTGPRTLISTVDAWCRREDFIRLVDAAARRSAQVSVLGVTPLVDDENPLWVDVDETGRVETLGGTSGAFVTAGVYMLSERARATAAPPLGRLREYLAWLLQQGEPLYAETIHTVVDVDRASDVALAETFVHGGSQ